jgi:hypothetical protein
MTPAPAGDLDFPFEVSDAPADISSAEPEPAVGLPIPEVAQGVPVRASWLPPPLDDPVPMGVLLPASHDQPPADSWAAPMQAVPLDPNVPLPATPLADAPLVPVPIMEVPGATPAQAQPPQPAPLPGAQPQDPLPPWMAPGQESLPLPPPSVRPGRASSIEQTLAAVPIPPVKKAPRKAVPPNPAPAPKKVVKKQPPPPTKKAARPKPPSTMPQLPPAGRERSPAARPAPVPPVSVYPPPAAPQPSALSRALPMALVFLLVFVGGGVATFFFLRSAPKKDDLATRTNDTRKVEDSQRTPLATQRTPPMERTPTTKRTPPTQQAPPTHRTPPPTEGTLVVSATADGPGHFKTIGEALRNAAPGTVIKIKPGSYTESLQLDRKVTLERDGEGRVVILADKHKPALAVQCDGCVVRNLHLQSQACPENKAEPVAVVVVSQGDVRLEGCDVSWQGDAGLGGTSAGACVEAAGSGSRPRLERCALHNGRWGLRVLRGAEPDLRQCPIENNQIGVEVDGARGVLTDCALERNRAVGILLVNGADPTLKETKVLRGAFDGVVIQRGARGTLEGCTIEGHDDGNGILIQDGAEPSLTRCSVSKNKVGLMVEGSGKGTLEDCPFAENRMHGVNVKAGQLSLKRCDVSGSRTGVCVSGTGVVTLAQCKVHHNAEWALEARGDACKLDAGACKRGDLSDNGKDPPWDVDSGATLIKPGD